MDEWQNLISAGGIPALVIAVAVGASYIISAVRKHHDPDDDESRVPDRSEYGLLARLYQGWLGYVARFGGEATLTDDERAVLRAAKDKLNE